MQDQESSLRIDNERDPSQAQDNEGTPPLPPGRPEPAKDLSLVGSMDEVIVWLRSGRVFEHYSTMSKW
jgi:hypothetical protein